jgi:uncharacterized protein (DUF302 family)
MSNQSSLAGSVEALQQQVASNTSEFTHVATVDHSRLAGEAGVEMPPCVVTIFSDPETNAPLIQANPMIGLDLPHRILAYAEPGADEASIAFGDADYLKRRHDVADTGPLHRYGSVLDEALAGTPIEIRRPVVTDELEAGFGIHELVSDFSFGETTERLRKVVSSQGDTVWFGEVDFQAEAATQDIDVAGAMMLLFGAPAPGGMCMAEFPRLGLDAFCQKLLVFEDDKGTVRVAFNNIVAFAELHYGRSNGPQGVVDSRLAAAFGSATSR